jgi:hypothetical protein
MKEHISRTNHFNGKIGVKSRVALSYLTEACRVVTKTFSVANWTIIKSNFWLIENEKRMTKRAMFYSQ